MVLRLAPWRARSAQALEEWSAASGRSTGRIGPSPDELDLSRTLEMAAAVLGDGDEPVLRFPRGDYTVPSRQRLALVDAAAWWLTDPTGGQELAHALIDGACADQVTAANTCMSH